MEHDDINTRGLDVMCEDLAATLGISPDTDTKTETTALSAARYDENPPDAVPDMLRRQAHLLDEMLGVLMNGHLAERLQSGRDLARWLDMVLRIQKQCTDTAKTIEAVDYMKACAAQSFKKRGGPLPPPPETGKQKEG